MQGPSHVGFALAGGVTISSVFSFLFPRPLSGFAESVLHALGPAWSYPTMLDWFQTPTLPVAQVPTFGMFMHKLTFYLVLAYCARLPDQIERREAGSPLPEMKHRGCSHSCCLLFFLVLLAWLLGTVGLTWFLAQHVTLNDFWLKECAAMGLGIFLAFVLHIVADSMTTMGIRAMWPDQQLLGLRLFSNKSPGEYLVLWGYIFLTGAFVALGVFGF